MAKVRKFKNGVLRWFGRELERRTVKGRRARSEQGLDEAAKMLVKDIKNSMGTGPARSQPGKPPNKQTWLLHNSLRFRRSGKNKRRIEAGAPYALFLELGTSRMAARPFIRPAVIRNKRKIRRMLRGSFRTVQFRETT